MMMGGSSDDEHQCKSQVTYWGPCDDYICSGSDSGHIFIWERASARLVRVLEADEHACNGIVPHPHLPLLASYGTISASSVWRSDLWID
eukprot:COSAG01_NODE_497_length_16267_cov_5.357558_20_plen_89_part_00